MISNEFKEADIIEVRISETTTVDCVNQVTILNYDHRKSYIRLTRDLFIYLFNYFQNHENEKCYIIVLC